MCRITRELTLVRTSVDTALSQAYPPVLGEAGGDLSPVYCLVGPHSKEENVPTPTPSAGMGLIPGTVTQLEPLESGPAPGNRSLRLLREAGAVTGLAQSRNSQPPKRLPPRDRQREAGPPRPYVTLLRLRLRGHHAVRWPPLSSLATAAAPTEAARDRDLSISARAWARACRESSVTVLRVLTKRRARWRGRAPGGAEASPGR